MNKTIVIFSFFTFLLFMIFVYQQMGSDSNENNNEDDYVARDIYYELEAEKDVDNGTYVITVIDQPGKLSEIDIVGLEIQTDVSQSNIRLRVVRDEDYMLTDYQDTVTVDFPYHEPKDEVNITNLSISITFHDNDDDSILTEGDEIIIQLKVKETGEPFFFLFEDVTLMNQEKWGYIGEAYLKPVPDYVVSGEDLMC